MISLEEMVTSLPNSTFRITGTETIDEDTPYANETNILPLLGESKTNAMDWKISRICIYVN